MAPQSKSSGEVVSLEAFQQAVGEWAEEAFPESTIRTMTLHLKREAKELLDALEAWERNQMPVKDDVVWPTVVEELADCFLIMLHIADRKGFSLEECIRHKFVQCQARQWGEPDEEGVVEQVRVAGE